MAAAQDPSSGSMAPPKVLVLYREFLKPGKQGASHEKTESAFVQAVTKAKWPQPTTLTRILSPAVRVRCFSFLMIHLPTGKKPSRRPEKSRADAPRLTGPA